MAGTNIRDYPAYQYNEIAMRYAPFACLVSCVASGVFYPASTRTIIAAGCLLLGTLFVCLRTLVLPRVKTALHLDLIVTVYYLAIFSLLWIDLWLADTPPSAVSVGCLIVVAGMLFASTPAFVITTAIGAIGWLTVKQMTVSDLSYREPTQLLIFIPMIAVIIRMAVQKTYLSLYTIRRRERENIEQLEEAMRQLKTETQRRQESESQLLHAQKTESLGILAAGVAHDFNNALLAISAFAENIRATSREGNIQTHADNIVTAVQQASGICRQMLTYAGRTSDQFGEVDLTSLTTEMLPLLKAAAKSAVQIDLTCHTRRAVIRGNTAQLQQVILNLVSNGAEAIDGYGNVTVTVSRETFEEDLSNIPETSFGLPLLPGTYFRLEVSDDGSGMSDETMLQMFDPYFTTKASGHGFGLSTVLGIVRSHKGTITINSNISEGTTVSLLFPAYGAAVADSNQFRLPRVRDKPTRSARKVLVIDDEDFVRTPMAEMLRLMEWDVVEVGSGSEAAAIVKANNDFSVIMIDYKMPGMNGQETLRVLRDAGCASPAILCSGFISEPEQEAVLAEFNGFLPKPFRREQLEEQLRLVVH